jgi:hypothetical protein
MSSEWIADRLSPRWVAQRPEYDLGQPLKEKYVDCVRADAKRF